MAINEISTPALAAHKTQKSIKKQSTNNVITLSASNPNLLENYLSAISD